MNSSFPEMTLFDKRPSALTLKLYTVSLSDIQRQDFSFWVEICPTQIQTDSAQVQRESKGSVKGKNIPFLALDQSGLPSWPSKWDSPHSADSMRRVYFHWTCWECSCFGVIWQIFGWFRSGESTVLNSEFPGLLSNFEQSNLYLKGTWLTKNQLVRTRLFLSWHPPRQPI